MGYNVTERLSGLVIMMHSGEMDESKWTQTQLSSLLIIGQSG